MCFTLKCKERIILPLLVLPLLSEILLAATLGIFSGETGKVGMLVIMELDHKVAILIANSLESSDFALNHRSSLSLSCTTTVSVNKLLLVMCIR